MVAVAGTKEEQRLIHTQWLSVSGTDYTGTDIQDQTLTDEYPSPSFFETDIDLHFFLFSPSSYLFIYRSIFCLVFSIGWFYLVFVSSLAASQHWQHKQKPLINSAFNRCFINPILILRAKVRVEANFRKLSLHVSLSMFQIRLDLKFVYTYNMIISLYSVIWVTRLFSILWRLSETYTKIHIFEYHKVSVQPINISSIL